MAASILRRLTKKQLCVFGLVLVTSGLFITFSTLTLFAKAPGLFFIYYTPFRNTFVSEYKSAKGEGFTDSLAANANPRSLDAAGNKAVKPRGEMKNDDEHWRSGFSAGTTSKSNDEIGIGNEDTHDRKALLLEDKDRDSDSDLKGRRIPIKDSLEVPEMDAEADLFFSGLYQPRQSPNVEHYAGAWLAPRKRLLDSQESLEGATR